MIKAYDGESTIKVGSKEAMCLGRCYTVKVIDSAVVNERFILQHYEDAIDIRQDTRTCFQFRLGEVNLVAKLDITEKIVFFKILGEEYK